MKYFLDTEFLEGTQKEKFPISLFKKNTPPTIDLISIGIVAEDGREYYSISKDFNLKEAWNRYDTNLVDVGSKTYRQKIYWLRENVLKPIFSQYYIEVFECNRPAFSYSSMEYLIEKIGKTNNEIALEVKRFCCNDDLLIALGKYKRSICSTENQEPFLKNPEFYAYYADYDWVVFCWLFGKMMDLPKGFPMYCKDLKQILDEKSMSYFESVNPGKENFNERLESMKNHPDYPKQENEHDALADARWNKKLFEFINKL